MSLPTFFGLNIGVNALEAMQQAQDVVGNNIANANTPGYVQEQAQLVEAQAYPPPGEGPILHGQLGQGSDVQAVTRQTDAFANLQDRINQGTYQMFQTEHTNLSQVESILNEPSSNGLQNALDQFFSAWQTLSTDPSNTAARQSVITQAQTLGQTFQTATTQLEQLQSGISQTVMGPPSYQAGIGTGSAGVSQASPPVQIASGVSATAVSSGVSGTYQLVFQATGGANGASYTAQLETSGATPQPIGSPVAITQAGSYVVGSSASGGAQFNITVPDPTTLFQGTLGTTGTYTQTDTFTMANGSLVPPTGQVGELNQYSTQVAALNKQIVQTIQEGQSPNALLDQRGLILDHMSQIANISYSENSDGSMNVSLGTSAMVKGDNVTALTAVPAAQLNQGQYPGVTSGSMAGNLSSLKTIHDLLGQMNTFLTQLSSQVNTQQESGYGLQSSANPAPHAPALFSKTTDGNGNVVLSVPETITPSDIAASDQPNQPGNNNNAVAMVQLQSATSFNGGTFDQGIGQMVSNLGIQTAAVISQEKTSQALAQQSSNLRQSISGVDTNQQAALMVQFQNSYNAAAKFISVYDSMLQTLINMVP